MIDCTLPDLADCQGRTIAELDLRARFGCSVVGIERQGFMIPLPAARVGPLPARQGAPHGDDGQVSGGPRFLGGVSGSLDTDSLFEEVRMEAIDVPRLEPRRAGRTLVEISPGEEATASRSRASTAGRSRILNPGGRRGPESRATSSLSLGTPVQIREFRGWLSEGNPATAEDGRPHADAP